MAKPHPHLRWADLFRNQGTKQNDLMAILRENILFRTLNKRELRYLSNVVYERIYQPNEVIFEEGDRGFGMYFIINGRIAITSKGPEGEALITLLGKGSFFGELSLIDPENIRTGTAISKDRSLLIGLFKPDLAEILERKPNMGVKILLQLSKVLGRRLLETTERITLLSTVRGLGQVRGDSY